MGLELTEKALGEQLRKSEEVPKKPGITNVHQGSDVSYGSTTIFYSTNFGHEVHQLASTHTKTRQEEIKIQPADKTTIQSFIII